MENKAEDVIRVCSKKSPCMPQVNHPTWNVIFFLRHEHAYFQNIYSSIYDSKDQKQLNNTKKKKFNLFPIIVSLQKNWKTKKFLVRHKTKTITGMFQALFGWKTFKKLCSTNICKLNASITH